MAGGEGRGVVVARNSVDRPVHRDDAGKLEERPQRRDPEEGRLAEEARVAAAAPPSGAGRRPVRWCGWPPARPVPTEAGRSPSSISMLRKNTRTRSRANAVIDQSAESPPAGRSRGGTRRHAGTAPTSIRGHGRIRRAEISGCRVGSGAARTQEPVLGSEGWQAQKPRCADGGSAMTRITGMRAAGAALLLIALTAAGVLLAPGGERGIVFDVLDVRHAAVAVRQRARHRRHRTGGDQLHHQHRATATTAASRAAPVSTRRWGTRSRR